MWRIILLIVLIVVLGLLVALNRTAADWSHHIVSGSAGELLYAASFDGGGTEGFNADWQQYDGRLAAAVSEGDLRLEIDQLDVGAFSTADPYFGDFDLRVNARAVAGPLDNAYGVVFRVQDRDNDQFADDSYYEFLISSDGYYQVSKVVNGELQVISDWIESSLINTGLDADNELRVVAQGDQFTLYINDERVSLCIPDEAGAQSTFFNGECIGGALYDTLTDADIAYGRVGVAARSFLDESAGAVVAAFDHVLVYAPGDEVVEVEDSQDA